jgi:hypothetical protein
MKVFFLSLAVLIFIVILTKIILFPKSPGDKKWAYWFYFPKYNVIPSSRESKKAKKLQNKLSGILFILAFFEMLLWFFIG